MHTVIYGALANSLVAEAFKFVSLVSQNYGKLFPSQSVCTSLIKACSKIQHVTMAMTFFNVLKNNYTSFINVIHYNALLDVCARAGQTKLVKDILQEMEKNNIKPNLQSYNSAIDSCSPNKSFEQANEFYEKMTETLQPDSYTFNHLIHCCDKTHEIEAATVFFDIMVERKLNIPYSLFSYFIILCVKKNRLDQVKKINKEMKKRGLEPNETVKMWLDKAGEPI